MSPPPPLVRSGLPRAPFPLRLPYPRFIEAAAPSLFLHRCPLRSPAAASTPPLPSIPSPRVLRTRSTDALLFPSSSRPFLCRRSLPPAPPQPTYPSSRIPAPPPFSSSPTHPVPSSAAAPPSSAVEPLCLSASRFPPSPFSASLPLHPVVRRRQGQLIRGEFKDARHSYLSIAAAMKDMPNMNPQGIFPCSVLIPGLFFFLESQRQKWERWRISNLHCRYCEGLILTSQQSFSCGILGSILAAILFFSVSSAVTPSEIPLSQQLEKIISKIPPPERSTITTTLS